VGTQSPHGLDLSQVIHLLQAVDTQGVCLFIHLEQYELEQSVKDSSGKFPIT